MSNIIPRRTVLKTAALGAIATAGLTGVAEAIPPEPPVPPAPDPTKPPRPPAQPTLRRLRVVEWNINEGHGAYVPGKGYPEPPLNYRLAAVGRYLKALNADVIMLNDMLIRSVMGGGVNQAEYLSRATGLGYWQAIKTNATGLTGWKAVAVLSRHPLSKPTAHPIVRDGRSTGFATMSVMMSFGGSQIRVLSSRMPPKNTADHSIENELGQQQTLALLNSLDRRTPLLFGADLNARFASPPGQEPASRGVQALMDDNTGLRNALVEPPLQVTRPDQIDFVLHRHSYAPNASRFSVRSANFGPSRSDNINDPDGWISDHPSIVVDYDFGPRAGLELRDGNLVRESNRPEVYVIYGQHAFWVRTSGVLARLYGGWGNVEVVPEGAIPDGSRRGIPVNGTIVREDGKAEVYVVDGGALHWLNLTALNRLGGWSRVRVVPPAGLSGMPIGSPYTS